MTDELTEQELCESADWELNADEERMEAAAKKQAAENWLEASKERTQKAKEDIAEIKLMYKQYVASLRRQEKICRKLLKMAMEKKQ